MCASSHEAEVTGIVIAICMQVIDYRSSLSGLRRPLRGLAARSPSIVTSVTAWLIGSTDPANLRSAETSILLCISAAVVNIRCLQQKSDRIASE